MSLHDELLGLMARQDNTCKICGFLATLPPDVAAVWQSELAAKPREIGHRAVVLALARRNVVLDEASVRRHRRNHVR